LAVGGEHGTAGVAGVDGDVRLDQSGAVETLNGDAAVETGNDASGQRHRLTFGEPDGRDLLADGGWLVGEGEDVAGQRSVGSDQGHVGLGVDADDHT